MQLSLEKPFTMFGLATTVGTWVIFALRTRTLGLYVNFREYRDLGSGCSRSTSYNT